MQNPTDSLQRSPANNYTLTLLSVFKKLWKRRFTIAVFFIVFGVLGTIYSLWYPITYMAQTIITPPISDQSFSGVSLGKDLPFDLSSAIFGSINADKEIVERYLIMLQSNRLRLGVIDSFKLAKRYGFGKKGKKYSIEDVMTVLSRKYGAFTNKGTVTITVIDKSPAIAAAMANFMVCMLDSINREISRAHMAEKREFMYGRMMENRDSMARCEERLVAFQKQHGIIDIGKQAEASVSAVAQTEVDMFIKELQLSLEESKFSPNTAGLFERYNDIKAMRDKLLKSEKTKKTALLFPIQRIPDQALTLQRLQRAVTITDILDRYLTQAYEEARIEEKTTVPTIAVLDPARVPQKRYQPKRKKIVLAFLGFGMGLGMIVAIVLDSLESSTKDASNRKLT